MLGAPRSLEADVAARLRLAGVAMGLAWTSYRADVLFIEVGRLPGAGALLMTGSQGHVMKESASAAVTRPGQEGRLRAWLAPDRFESASPA